MTERATGDRVHAQRAGPEPPWDASDGDVAEQRRPAATHPEVEELAHEVEELAPEELAPEELAPEADPADVLEQRLAVPAEPDEYR